MMFGVGEATRRVLEGDMTLTDGATVSWCVWVTVRVSVAISMAVSVITTGTRGGGRACCKTNTGSAYHPRTILEGAPC